MLLRFVYAVLDRLSVRDYPPREWRDGHWHRMGAFPKRTDEENRERIERAQDLQRERR